MNTLVFFEALPSELLKNILIRLSLEICDDCKKIHLEIAKEI